MKKTIFGETGIKRFGCDVYYDQGMYEDPNGAFVSYEDHAKVVAALNDILCAIAEKGVKLCQETATVYERYNITEMPDGALVDMQTVQEFSQYGGTLHNKKAELGRYVYHYCAASDGGVFSGIAQLPHRITSHTHLEDMKKKLANDCSFDARAITSLSYLGRELEGSLLSSEDERS